MQQNISANNQSHNHHYDFRREAGDTCNCEDDDDADDDSTFSTTRNFN